MNKKAEAEHTDATQADVQRVALTPESIAIWAQTLIPMIREVIRQELAAVKPLDEPWYEPAEVAAMSCGKISGVAVRNWVRWGQIDGESTGRRVRIYQSTIEELRKNKWRPLRNPDPSKLPPSKKPKITHDPSEPF